MRLTRQLRTFPQRGINPASLLSGVWIAELISPSAELWLVSAWVSDAVVVDNGAGEFDALFCDEPLRQVPLSRVLGELMKAGTQVHVAIKSDPHNEHFLERLDRASSGDRLHRHESQDLHEKTVCGSDWIMQGSMNFTWNGMHRNEEAVTLQVDRRAAARNRIELRQRWQVPRDD